MTTTLEDLLVPHRASATPALFIDHTAFGAQRILRRDLPWTEAVELAAYYGKAQALLGSDATVIPVKPLVEAVLAKHPALTSEMAARPRTGYALRTLLASDTLGEALARALSAIPHTSRAPLALLIPSPLVWLAQAQQVGGNPDLSGITADHAESAAIYVSDWLRRFAETPVRFLVLDGRRTRGDTLPLEDLHAYTPVANAAEHYRWSLLHIGEDRVTTAGSGVRANVLPEGFWDNAAPAPEADILITSVPTHCDPEAVLARLASLR
jgi:hypothetical protein